MKRPSKRTREQAALICAVAASNPKLLTFTGIAARLYFPVKAVYTAFAAWNYVDRSTSELTCQEHDAEAEALLRTGWCPDD